MIWGTFTFVRSLARVSKSSNRLVSWCMCVGSEDKVFSHLGKALRRVYNIGGGGYHANANVDIQQAAKPKLFHAVP